MRAGALLVFALLLPLAAPAADACAALNAVPCGRIYPIILLSAGEGAPQGPQPMTMGVPLETELTLTYKFDAMNDGYTVAAPNEPVIVTFEFPRKPAWVDLKVEPERVDIPVNDPTLITPTPDTTAPQAWYEYSTTIKVSATLTGQAVLRDGYDFAKLLVFAKSTESGLYQAGYGIKEIRVSPEGALHESDVAGQRDVFVASPLPALVAEPSTATAAGLTATLAPPEGAKFWEPASWRIDLDPAPTGSAFVAVHDELGDLVAAKGPIDASSGSLVVNATLARPGLHTFTVTLLPAAGSTAPPVTLALDVAAGVTDAEGFEYPKVYLVQESGAVPAPTLATADPNFQWERDVPFFAFDSAQAVSAVVTLNTPGPGAALARGVANVQVLLLDPDGNLLATNSVDAYNPQKAMRVGSVPSEGWYTLRLRGVGAPVLATYDARIEVDYVAPPKARNRADGVADITPPLLARAGRNLTLPLDALGVWAPGDVTPKLDDAGNVQHSVTIYGNGTLAYASGLRSGKATFTPPAPGTYRAFAFAQPTFGSPFSPLVRAFTFAVGEGQRTTATTFPLDDAPTAPTSASEMLLAIYQVPLLEGAGEPKLDTTASAAWFDADGARVDKPTAPGTYFLHVTAANAGAERDVPVQLDLAYAAPVTLVGPDALGAASDRGALGVPGFAVAGALLAAGAVAVSFALLRRR